MRKNRHIITRTAGELAEAFGLSPADAVEMEIRCQIKDKIVLAMKQSGLTHAQLAKAVGMSRSRLTAILNRNTAGVSTDLMFRILAVLGYRTRLSFRRMGHAA